MTQIKVEYKGQLRTTATHISSESSFQTDAPTDNHGKGESFAPTDLLAASALTCMITVMGITAEKNDIHMGNVNGEVEKIMTIAPRKVAQLNVELQFDDHNLSDTDKSLLENAALGCPVTLSLHPDIAVNVKFRYN